MFVCQQCGREELKWLGRCPSCNEWNSFYEGQIEPVNKQMQGEYTRKLFTRKERGFGNAIMFDSSSLAYASMSTKLGLVQMVDRGAMTPNEWRLILNLSPLEGGDIPVRRSDTAPVKGGEIDENDTNQRSDSSQLR